MVYMGIISGKINHFIYGTECFKIVPFAAVRH